MWDAGLVTRVKDRKLNEILIFASMAKIDQENIDEYIDIIEMLGDDINGCDALLDTEGEAEIALESIESDEYRCRLSVAEAADEDLFNSMKVAPDYEQPDLDYVKKLITDAVESIKTDGCSTTQDSQSVIDELEFENKKNLKIILNLEEQNNELASEIEKYKSLIASKDAEISSLRIESERKDEGLADAISSLKEENAILRSRNNELSAQLDYCQESIATVESERDELRAVLSASSSECDDMIEESEPTADVAETEVNGCEPAEQPADEHEVVDPILTDGEVALIDKIIEMKTRKIDEFIDKSLDNEISDDVSDDIVTFLKEDVVICETLKAIDCSSFDKIVDGLKNVLNIVENSTESRYHKIYHKSLSEEDKGLEDAYVEILSKIHDVISSRYLPYIRGVVS